MWKSGVKNIRSNFSLSRNTWWSIPATTIWEQCVAYVSLHKKWSFLLRISSVNVAKSAVSCGFGHIYWRSP